MKIARTFDYDLVRSIMTHPRVYPSISDDGSPQAQDYEPPQADCIIYLLAEGAGVFMLVPENACTIQVHTCLTPPLWGRSTDIAIAGREWVFENTPYQRITTNVPESNKLAQRLAVRSGMTEYGRNPKSYLKGGVLMDQILYGISKD